MTTNNVTGLTPNTMCTYTITVMANNGIEDNRSVSVSVTTKAMCPITTTGMLTERCNVYNTYTYTPMLTHIHTNARTHTHQCSHK